MCILGQTFYMYIIYIYMYVCMRMYIQREGDSDIGNSETTASHKEMR